MAAPVNTVAPAITGTVEVGYTLTCSQGTWTGTPTSYAYQWRRTGDSTTAVSGATASTYVVSALDTGYTLTCAVTATNADGSTSAASDATAAVPDDWLAVETGSGSTTANTYCSLAAADTYHSQRGNTAWPLLSVGQRKAALVRATDWLEQRYVGAWAGEQHTDAQALSWPRAGAYRKSLLDYYDDDEIPADLVKATAELALRAHTAALSPDLTAAITEREKVGPLEVEYSPYTNTGETSFPAVAGLLRHLLIGAQGGLIHPAVRV